MGGTQNFNTLFSIELERIARAADFSKRKPRLLLHACCAPCSSAVLERLAGYFEITVFYYNPNIHPEAEYTRRLEELSVFLNKRLLRANNKTTALIRTDYNPQDFFSAVNIENFPERAYEAERGKRCEMCYRFRMKKTALYALKNGFDYFTTTLSVSPHKSAEKINATGIAVEKELNAVCALRYLYADFKKQNGYKRSLEISAEYDLYRQDYCGCVYSKKNNVSRETFQPVKNPVRER